ncbi:MAG: hypothetical protein JWO56_2019, partial [Acidobacteria bacterium]|nr:hypothetical protein [Acidobacteriota bacterium]
MQEFTFAVLATFTAQTFGAAVMALLLLGFHRQYHKSYLLHWTLGWTSLALYHLAMVGALALGLQVAGERPLTLAASLIAAMAGYMQI